MPVYTSWRNGRSCDVLELCQYIPAKGMAHNSLYQHLCAVLLYQQLLHILETERESCLSKSVEHRQFSHYNYFTGSLRNRHHMWLRFLGPFPVQIKKKNSCIRSMQCFYMSKMVWSKWSGILLNCKRCRELLPSAPHTQALGTQGLLTIVLHTKGTSNSYLHLSCTRRQMLGHRAYLYLFSY